MASLFLPDIYDGGKKLSRDDLIKQKFLQGAESDGELLQEPTRFQSFVWEKISQLEESLSTERNKWEAEAFAAYVEGFKGALYLICHDNPDLGGADPYIAQLTGWLKDKAVAASA